MAREIAVDHDFVGVLGGRGVDRVRARTDEREIALDDDVEELRQFVERGLADEAADARHARIATRHLLGRGVVELVDIHRAELEDLDFLVVEAVPLLAEEDGSLGIEFHRERDQAHHRQEQHEQKRADDTVEGRLDDHVPVGDRLVEDVEHRHRADPRIGARAEPQLVGVGGQANVDRQNPELAQHLEDAFFRRDRQGEDDEIDARAAREFHEIVDRAEFREADHDIGRTIVGAIVEHAADAQIGVTLGGEFAQHLFARRPAADDDGAALETAARGHAAHDDRQDETPRQQQREAGEEPGHQPDAGIGEVVLEEEDGGERQEECEGPPARNPQHGVGGIAERGDVVDVERLERGERDEGNRGDGDGDFEGPVVAEIGGMSGKACAGHGDEFEEADEPCQNRRRIGWPGAEACQRFGERDAPQGLLSTRRLMVDLAGAVLLRRWLRVMVRGEGRHARRLTRRPDDRRRPRRRSASPCAPRPRGNRRARPPPCWRA